MKKNTLTILLIVLIAFTQSCKKDGASTPTIGTNSDYQPTTANSFWKFKDSTTGLINTLTSVGTSKLINGEVYSVFSSASLLAGSSEGYFQKKNKDYTFLNLFNVTGTSSGSNFAIKYLNDSLPAGSKWDYTLGTLNGANTKATTTIKAKGGNLTVEGKTYADIIHTQSDILSDLSALSMGWVKVAQYDFYAAKGVGIVKIEINVLHPTPYRLVNNLTDFQIK